MSSFCCALAPAVEREETLAIICTRTLIVITYPKRGREIHGSAACACNRPIVDEISRHLPLFFFFFFFFFVVFSFFQHVVTRSKVKRHSPWWLHCLRLFLKRFHGNGQEKKNEIERREKKKERKKNQVLLLLFSNQYDYVRQVRPPRMFLMLESRVPRIKMGEKREEEGKKNCRTKFGGNFFFFK